MAKTLYVVNHSGGKDSQATYLAISKVVPHDQIEVVHADLGDDVEHLGVQEHIKANINHPLHVATAVYKDGTRKTLLDYIRRRGMWPSSAARYCTSDLKRGPCEKVIRRLVKEHEADIVISCFGFRAEESAARAKRPVIKRVERNCTKTREWYDYSPIHKLDTEEVFKVIRDAGQEPHPMYAKGNERLSCVFCVLASQNDLRNGALARPELLETYLEMERDMDHTFTAKKSLAEIVGREAA